MTKIERIRRGILAAIAIIEDVEAVTVLRCEEGYGVPVSKDVPVKDIRDIYDAYAAIAGIKEGVGAALVRDLAASGDGFSDVDTLNRLRKAAITEVYGLDARKERAK